MTKIFISIIVSAFLFSNQFTQEARYRTIGLGMLQANTLYGSGIPYLLDIHGTNRATGFRLLTFGGSFYALYKYTERMNLPYGRSDFQYTGSILGSLSLYPILAIVGFDNWSNFDEDGKVSLLYQMIAVPSGLFLSDRLYHKWKLTNGQATIVSSAPALGVYNTFMLLWLIKAEEWDEDITRFFVPLIYGGALAHGYWAKNYVENKSYSRDDGSFLSLSAGIGLFNSFGLMMITESDNEQFNKLLLLAGINGFTYLGEKINQQFDLKKGQTNIIVLGTLAAGMTWGGIAYLLDLKDEKIWMAGNMASITLGWFMTHKTLVGSSKYSSNTKLNNFMDRLSIRPTFQMRNKNINPVIQLQIKF